MTTPDSGFDITDDVPSKADLIARPFLAVPPFKVAGGRRWASDAEDSYVLVCDREETPCYLYSENKIDLFHGHFMCPKCGRIGLRMEEATPKQCGL